MPRSPVHDQKRQKNLVVLGLIVALILLVFMITILRMNAAKDEYEQQQNGLATATASPVNETSAF